MSSDLEHWHIDAKVYDDRVEETHLFSDPARNIRRKPYTTVWHIERYLGHGSFGEVRLERNRNEEKVRAVKRVPTSSSTLSRKECEQELEALLEFSKPKSKDAAIFVEFFGWFNSGFNIYLVMEYIELGDLEKNVQSHSGKLPEVEAQSIAEQILSGLEIMHNASFAHRDLKPQNVLVVVGPPQWWIKLADFGISKRLTDSTAYRTSAGTLPYMAPEVLKYSDFATSGEYTNAVDLWAVGCIIYRLITGIVPFPQGKSLIEYCGNTLLFPNDPLTKSGVADSGSKFVQQLLDIDPKERPSAAKALQHHWITSFANTTPIPSSASHPSLEKAELSGSAFSRIEYNTASHAGLKSYDSSTSFSTSTVSALKAIPPTASPATTSKMFDGSYLMPRQSLQQNVLSDSKGMDEKDPKASFNDKGAQYGPETTVKTWENNIGESAAIDDMPVELDSKSDQSPFPDALTESIELIRSNNFELRREPSFEETPETLQSKYELGLTLYSQDQYQKAEEVFREIVLGREKVLGKEDPKTLDSKHWLAQTFYMQEQYQKAEEVCRQVVLGQEKVLGKDDLETFNSKYLLAQIFLMQEQYHKAEEVFREIVLGQEKVLGTEDSETLDSKHLLAQTFLIQEQYHKGEELCREVVLGREKVLGKEDSETLDSKHLLAQTFLIQEQYHKAEEVFREIVLGREKVLGKKDPKTLDSKHWLAQTFYMQKQYQKAEEVCREVVLGQKKVLGKGAPDTRKSKQLLNKILDNLETRKRKTFFLALKRAFR